MFVYPFDDPQIPGEERVSWLLETLAKNSNDTFHMKGTDLQPRRLEIAGKWTEPLNRYLHKLGIERDLICPERPFDRASASLPCRHTSCG